VKWTDSQADAIEAVVTWYNDSAARKEPFRLFGYAGSGKTTLAKYIVEALGVYAIFAAFTGKAASVLRRSGCPLATTLHSLMYQPKDKSREGLRKLQVAQASAENPSAEYDRLEYLITEEKKKLKQPSFSLLGESDIEEADLVVVDEVSMVNTKMGEDLLSFGTPVLVLGDPGQLPPPFGGGYFTNAEPNVMLTEIHRQAKNNPIIEMATMAREGTRIPEGEYGASRVQSGLKKEEALAYDQALCWTNKTRRETNARFRDLQGRTSPFPEAGERLVCLKNNHKKALLNGSIWHVMETPHDVDDQLHVWIESEEGEVQYVAMYKAPFIGEELHPWDQYAERFDFGYCLTVHKSQGSQWKKVLLFDESSRMKNQTERRGWLYTGITRASEELLIVRD